MLLRRRITAALVMAVAVLLSACNPSSVNKEIAKPFACDRFCLQAHMDRFLDAMLRHDSSTLPLAQNFRYRENNQAIALGDGSWQTLQSLGGYKHYFADPQSGTAALITLQHENDEGGLLTLRIHVEAGRLDEAEVVLTHSQEAFDAYTKLGKPADNWMQPVPEDERMSREQLAAMANKYLGSLENNDGKGDYSFFEDDCTRLENGVQTTNVAARPYDHTDNKEFVTLGCRGQLETGLFGFITRIRDRRYEVIDVERGAVFAIAVLDHDGTARTVPLTNGDNLKVPTYYSAARSIQVGVALQSSDNHLNSIESTSHELPYGQRTAFGSTFEPSSAVPGGKQAIAGSACDRDCIAGGVDQLLAAMASQDPLRAPLAGLVRYTENDQQIAIGDGLWGTLTQVGSVQLQVVDGPQAWVLVRVTETDLPGLLALRLRFIGDRIAEIEAQLVREERVGSEEQFRMRLPFDPQPTLFTKVDPLFSQTVELSAVQSRDALSAVVEQWFTAVQAGLGNGALFAPNCLRRDNAVTVTGNLDLPRSPPRKRPGNELRFTLEDGSEFKPFALDCTAQLASGYTAYITRARHRRILLIDESRGVVVARALFDVPGTVHEFTNADGNTVRLPLGLRRPTSIAVQAAFKIQDNKIVLIEGLSKPHAYGMRPAWPPLL